jgi:hypothetical protein
MFSNFHKIFLTINFQKAQKIGKTLYELIYSFEAYSKLGTLSANIEVQNLDIRICNAALMTKANSQF